MRSTQGTYYKFFNLSTRIDLGNVRAVISDCKFTYRSENENNLAELLSAIDYYAFGCPLYGRKYESQVESYRFGYKGKACLSYWKKKEYKILNNNNYHKKSYHWYILQKYTLNMWDYGEWKEYNGISKINFNFFTYGIGTSNK